MKKEKVVVGGWKGSSLHINVSTSFTSNDVLLGLSSSVPSLLNQPHRKEKRLPKSFQQECCMFVFSRGIMNLKKAQALLITNTKKY